MVDTLIFNTLEHFYRHSSPKVFCKKAYSKNFHKIHRESPAIEYFFKKIAGQVCHCTLDKAPLSFAFRLIFLKFSE